MISLLDLKEAELITKKWKRRASQAEGIVNSKILVITKYWEEACVAVGVRMTGTELGKCGGSVHRRPYRQC